MFKKGNDRNKETKHRSVLRRFDHLNFGNSDLFRVSYFELRISCSQCSTAFEELGIPEPDVNLGAGSDSQAEQTAAIMIGYEKVINGCRFRN